MDGGNTIELDNGVPIELSSEDGLTSQDISLDTGEYNSDIQVTDTGVASTQSVDTIQSDRVYHADSALDVVTTDNCISQEITRTTSYSKDSGRWVILALVIVLVI